MQRHTTALVAALASATLAACGGAAGNTPSGIAPVASASPVAATATPVTGSVSVTAADAYGPAVFGAATYASADAYAGTPLAGATLVIGGVPVSGARLPAVVPSADVVVTTDAFGNFTATVPGPPVAPASSEPFVIPANNLTAFVPPASGFYVEIFGPGTDGVTAGMPIPLHRFVAAGSKLAFRVSIASSAEASALAAVNADRAVAGAAPLIFDESAVELARLHASDESANAYTCHYDANGVGPSSRYVAGGGMGLTGEALALVGAASPAAAFQIAEAAFIAEKLQTPPGGHALNVLDPSHLWAGLAASNERSAPNYYNVDYELITPNSVSSFVGSSGYPVTLGCPANVTNNQS